MKKISVLALVLLFSASVAIANQTGPKKQYKVYHKAELKYIVKANALKDIPDGQYLVETDEFGNPVGPPVLMESVERVFAPPSPGNDPSYIINPPISRRYKVSISTGSDRNQY